MNLQRRQPGHKTCGGSGKSAAGDISWGQVDFSGASIASLALGRSGSTWARRRARGSRTSEGKNLMQVMRGRRHREVVQSFEDVVDLLWKVEKASGKC